MKRVTVFSLLLMLAATGVALAQEVVSTRLRAPSISPYPILVGSMGVPDGSYRVRVPDYAGAPEPRLDADITYQIACAPVRGGGALPMPNAHSPHRCTVTEISSTPACVQCTPHAISFPDVSFVRHTSSLPDARGFPVTDYWHGELRIGGRIVRLFIGFDRFVVQDMDEREPSIAIVEAVIERPGEVRRRVAAADD